MTKTRNGKAAKRTKNGKTNGVPETALIPEDAAGSAPEGFEAIFGDRVVGWWALIPGNTIRGILRDVFTTKSKFSTDGKHVYKVELTEGGTKVVSADEDAEGEVIEAAVGDLVGVDEKGFLKALSRAVGREVWISYRGKEGPSADYPQGRHVFVGPFAKPGTIDKVTGEVIP